MGPDSAFLKTILLLVFGVYDDLTIHVWDVFSGEELFVLSGHSKTPGVWDGLGAGDATQDGTRLPPMVRWAGVLWDYGTGREVTHNSVPIRWALILRLINPDETKLATWGFDNTIKVGISLPPNQA